MLSHSRIHVADRDTDIKIQHPSGNRSNEASQPIVTVTAGNTLGPTGTSFWGIVARQKQPSAMW